MVPAGSQKSNRNKRVFGTAGAAYTSVPDSDKAVFREIVRAVEKQRQREREDEVQRLRGIDDGLRSKDNEKNDKNITHDDCKGVRNVWTQVHLSDDEIGQTIADYSGLLGKRKVLKRIFSEPPIDYEHDDLLAINAQLRKSVQETREMLLDERQTLARQLQSENVLRAREFSFCLFPETRLKKLLLDLCSASR